MILGDTELVGVSPVWSELAECVQKKIKITAVSFVWPKVVCQSSSCCNNSKSLQYQIRD